LCLAPGAPIAALYPSLCALVRRSLADMTQEREGLDRTIVSLPGAQGPLIQQVSHR